MVPFRVLIHAVSRHSFFLISKTYISRGPFWLVCLSFELGIRSTFHPEAVVHTSRICSKDSNRRGGLSKVESHKVSGSFHWLYVSMACATAVLAITRIFYGLRRPYMLRTLSPIQISVKQISARQINSSKGGRTVPLSHEGEYWNDFLRNPTSQHQEASPNAIRWCLAAILKSPDPAIR